MGIAGSIVDADFFQTYLGMRNEQVDMTEVIRRIDEGIYDKTEYTKAIAWTEKYCKVNEGTDFNTPKKKKNRTKQPWNFNYGHEHFAYGVRSHHVAKLFMRQRLTFFP